MIVFIRMTGPLCVLLCLANLAVLHSPRASCAAGSIQGTILQEDISTSERAPVLVRSFAVPPSSEGLPPQEENTTKKPQTLTANPKAENATSSKPSPKSPSSTTDRESSPAQTVPTEYLIDKMDVYALSPHAARLALPRMVSPLLVWKAHEGKASLPAPAAWKEFIQRASQIHGLAPALIAAVIRVESNFENLALSDKGAQGLMQLMPGTQQELGVADPYDPEANVMAGCTYLRRQLDAFGSLELALAAYNAGPANVRRYGGIPPFAETQNFVRKVLRYMETNSKKTHSSEGHAK